MTLLAGGGMISALGKILTNELLVPYVQSHISESGSHSTHNFVVVYPQ